MTQEIRRNSTQYGALLEKLAHENPRLYDILKLMSGDIEKIQGLIDPIASTVQRISSSVGTRPLAPEIFAFVLTPTAVVFTWSSSDANTVFYELRSGANWETGTFVLRTSSLSAAIDPLPSGNHDYMLKTLSASLVECEDEEHLQVVIPTIPAPSVSATVIDNNVLLSWTIPTSTFGIDHYNVYRDTVKFAEIGGNFLVRFEAASGTYEYAVEAVDVAGSIGTQGTVQATVRQPPDYVLQDTRSMDLVAATKVNALYEAGYVIACVDVTETFAAHFTSQSWAAPSDQVAAGFDRYIQENLLTGSVEEQHDYGTILSNIIVTVNYIKEIYSGTNDVTVTVKMDVSDDGIAWAGYTSGSSQFFQSFRYLRVKLDLTATDSDSMIRLSNVQILLNVKREVDSGTTTASAGDSGGTTVLFNKTFKDVDSVTAESDDVQPLDAIVDFVDTPNPTSFKVLVFDTKGQRANATVYWKARGIV